MKPRLLPLHLREPRSIWKASERKPWNAAISCMAASFAFFAIFPWASAQDSTLSLGTLENRMRSTRYEALKTAGRMDETLDAAQKWLAICEAQHGPDHPNTASALHSIASLHHLYTGFYGIAESSFQRALTIREKHLGMDHIDTALTKNELGVLYWSMGLFQSAETLFQDSLRIRERHLGATHVDTAESLLNLASVYSATNRFADGKEAFLRVLDIQEKALPAGHSSISATLSGLTALYLKANQPDKGSRPPPIDAKFRPCRAEYA